MTPSSLNNKQNNINIFSYSIDTKKISECFNKIYMSYYGDWVFILSKYLKNQGDEPLDKIISLLVKFCMEVLSDENNGAIKEEHCIYLVYFLLLVTEPSDLVLADVDIKDTNNNSNDSKKSKKSNKDDLIAKESAIEEKLNLLLGIIEDKFIKNKEILEKLKNETYIKRALKLKEYREIYGNYSYPFYDEALKFVDILCTEKKLEKVRLLKSKSKAHALLLFKKGNPHSSSIFLDDFYSIVCWLKSFGTSNVDVLLCKLLRDMETSIKRTDCNKIDITRTILKMLEVMDKVEIISVEDYAIDFLRRYFSEMNTISIFNKLYVTKGESVVRFIMNETIAILESKKQEFIKKLRVEGSIDFQYREEISNEIYESIISMLRMTNLFYWGNSPEVDKVLTMMCKELGIPMTSNIKYILKSSRLFEDGYFIIDDNIINFKKLLWSDNAVLSNIKTTITNVIVNYLQRLLEELNEESQQEDGDAQ